MATSDLVNLPAENAPLLRVRNLMTSFHAGPTVFQAVRDISFELGRNETLAIVGESGSGKSVTALSILRLLAANTRVSGAIEFEGEDILAASVARMREIRGGRVGMIFQEPMTSLNPVMPVGKQIAEALTAHGQLSGSEAQAEAIRLMDRVRIPSAGERFDQYPHEFSGGMRQRAMIAMALSCKPTMLIADEPTTALDVTVQAQVLDLLRELQRDFGMGILFITHDMGVVAEIADRILVMRHGEIVESGDTERVFNAPAHDYTQMLLAAVPRLGATIQDGPRIETRTIAAEPVLDVKNLTSRYPVRRGWRSRIVANVHAVENVSFALQPGETLAIVGESGCGKSTTGLAIVGLQPAISGQVRLAGQDVLQLKGEQLRRARRQIQMIFQDPFASLNPRMKVADLIAEPYLEHGLGTRAEARALVGTLLEQVGLKADMADRLPHQFSGGQRQRICIARALVVDPKLIVADESLSALDVSVKAQIVQLLKDIQRQRNLAYLFISHDMAVVEQIAHRVAVMYLGEIVEVGPRAAVLGNPQHPYTRKLISAVPQPDPALRKSKKPVPVEDLPNPTRAAGYEPPLRTYQEVSDGHFIMA